MAHQSLEPPKYISASRVKEVLKYEDLIPVIEQALVNFSARRSGGVVQPVRTAVEVENRGFFLVMPAYSAKDNALAVKLVTGFPENEKQGLPSFLSNVMVLDPKNGLLQAIMDGIPITDMRTAAASAVATKFLASESTEVLCILGSGAQARSHVEALKFVKPFTELADEIGAKACATVEEAVSGADVIVTATLATEPVLFGKWVKPGALINSVGAPRPTWREMDDETMHNSFIVADSIEAASKEAGDVILSKATVAGEIGDVISGKLAVPEGKTRIFKSLGMALEDVVSAKLVLSKLGGLGGTPLDVL
ncbi:ketimine reductase mu-crystallin-like isoform X2 [Pocillopora damicornis]|uniref:ketimine reductase mu-crystallin-like isoform X2 n=1 Tax=Pocillopora damicornis TaxID=46731 RepID=UPI000F54FA15|nr:ketimine reductase mu-crystallin-like isoform X2 [Pocillopora damicornis]